ncbi:MAG: hypothetical protein FK730_04455 [Asgard group archaeon]|nr:hypothetical protein [Asgard group archaeon]
MFKKPSYNDSWKGMVLRSIIVNESMTFREIQKDTGMNSNALNRTLAVLLKLKLIQVDEDGTYFTDDIDLIRKYSLYYKPFSRVDSQGYALMRMVLDPIVSILGLILFFSGIRILNAYLMFAGLVLFLTVVGFELFLFIREKQRPYQQIAQAERNESFLHYFPKNIFIEYPLTDFSDLMKTSLETKQVTIQNFILSIPFLKSNEKQKIEYPFNYNGQQGFIDNIRWVESSIKNEATIALIKIKPDVIVVGETIREVHNHIDYLKKDVDGIFGKFQKKTIYSFLAVQLNQKNLDLIKKYKQMLVNSEIDAIIFIYEKKRLLYFTFAKEIVLPSLDFLKPTQITCFYCGQIMEPKDKECPQCSNPALKCVLCKLPISFGDRIGQCALCEAKGHLTHMQEWIKTQGKCPHCLRSLPLEGIIPEKPPK